VLDIFCSCELFTVNTLVLHSESDPELRDTVFIGFAIHSSPLPEEGHLHHDTGRKRSRARKSVVGNFHQCFFGRIAFDFTASLVS